MYVETSYFLIFQNILGTKNFRNRMNLFSSSAKYYFYKRSVTFNETFLTLSSLACNIFTKDSCFLLLDISQVQKSVDVITCFFCTVKKQKFRSIHQCCLSLSVWCLFCSFTPFLSVLFVLHRKNLVLLHLMNRYTTSTIE